MKEGSVATGTVTPPTVVQYEYEFNYDYKPKTTSKATAKAEPSDDKSLLTLLSRAASAVVKTEEMSSSSAQQKRRQEQQGRQELGGLGRSQQGHRVPPSPPKSSSPQPQATAREIDRFHQGHHRPLPPPPLSSTLPSVVSQGSLDRALRHPHGQHRSPPPPHFVAAPPPIAYARMPPEASSPPSSILAVFPQYPPSASALPMPPGMEITLAHPHPHHFATAAPSSHREAKLGMVSAGGGSSFHPHRRAAGASKRAATAAAAAAGGKAASVHKAAGGNSNSSKNSKYKMKYHYVSMKRWEAYRYIDSLAQGSGYRPWTPSAIPHHGLVMGGTVSPALGASPPPNTRSAMIPIPSTGHGSYNSAATLVVPPH